MTRLMTRTRLSLAGVLSLVALPCVAQTVVFDSGANILEGGAISHYFSDVDASLFTGDNFTLLTPNTVDTVRFTGIYAGATDPVSNTDNFTIAFYNTVAGVPDATPFVGGTFASVATTRTDTGRRLGTFELYEYVATLDTPVAFTAGTFGISITNDTLNNINDNWMWSARDGQGTAFSRNNQSRAWTSRIDNMGFVLLNSSSSAAPEPATLALLLPVAVGILARRKRMAK